MPDLNRTRRLKEALDSFDVASEGIKIINANAKFIIELLQSQLERGVDRYGNKVLLNGSPDYSEITKYYKRKYGVGLGREIRFVTNYMTGAFYAEMYVVTSAKKFEIESAVPYFSNIIARSGPQIMELSQANYNIFAGEILVPQLKISLENHIRSRNVF